jgi:hypothetical protein
MVVVDTKPLPEALSLTVIPPEKILPTEVWQDWHRRRHRGAAVINALKQRAAAEKLAKGDGSHCTLTLILYLSPKQ